MIKKVVFDAPCLLGFFKNYFIIKGADEIVLFQLDSRFFNSLKMSALQKLVHILLRKKLHVQAINDWDCYPINPDAIQTLEKHTKEIDPQLTGAIKMFLGGTDADIIKYIKKSLLDPLAKKTSIAEKLLSEPGPRSLLIITPRNMFGVYDSTGDVYEICFQGLFRNYIFRLFLIVSALFVIFFQTMKKFRIMLRRKEWLEAELVAQANTLSYEDDIRKEFLSEDLVVDKNKVALIITETWRLRDAAQMLKYRQHLSRKGIRNMDVRDMAVDVNDLAHLFCTIFKNTFRSSPAFLSWDDFYLFCRFVSEFLRESIYLNNYKCKAILGFDDYSGAHVVRTLLCRQKGLKSYGIQHSAGNGLHGVPQLAYVCFDKYLIFGNFYKELFSPFWDGIELAKLSYNRIDRFIRRRKGENTDMSYAQNIMSGKKMKILITLPSTTSFDHFMTCYKNAYGMLNFLKSLDSSILEKASIYIRPKYKNGIEDMQRYINNEHVKFVLEDACTTTQLLSLADLVVASDGSAIIAECSLLRVRILTYDYLGFLKKYWTKFGADMCCDSAEQLIRVLHAFLCGESLDIDWEYLWADMVYPNNGNTNKVIEGLLDELISGRAA